MGRPLVTPLMSCAVLLPATARMVPWRGHTWPQAMVTAAAAALASTDVCVRPHLSHVYVDWTEPDALTRPRKKPTGAWFVRWSVPEHGVVHAFPAVFSVMDARVVA